MRVVRFLSELFSSSSSSSSACSANSSSANPPVRSTPPRFAVGHCLDQLQRAGFCVANSSPISSPTSARSGHCWTSTAGFCVANSSPISSPTSARSGHGWTSTAGFRSEWARWARLDLNRQVPSAVVTAEPQPGTFRAQWAALDLNLGPSELSGHRWTSTAR